jgi:similar to stage IV sporulation protein
MYDADADIYIQTTLEYNLKINKTYSKTYYTGNNINSKFIQIYNYRIDGIKILDFFLAKWNMKYETVTYRRQLVLTGNVYLPIYYGKITQREYYMQYLTYTQEDMEEGLVQEIEKIIEGLEENNIKIVEKNLKMVQNRNDMELYASLVVIKPADITKSIYEDIKE